jgi:rhodanese-related sulfurtransferase
VLNIILAVIINEYKHKSGVINKERKLLFMKKIISATSLTLVISLLMLTGCGQKSDNITFTATIESIHDKSIMVTTTDEIGFDKASVGFDKELEIPFDLIVGQRVEIEALPQVRESYPVQITAVRISLKEEATKDEGSKDEKLNESSNEESQKAEYRKISPSQAIEMMDEDSIILDVRTQSEFDEGHIPNAVLLPGDEIAQRADEVLPDKDQTILVYCRSGRRSALAAKELVELGYTNVYDFGGILDWPGDLVK